MHYALSVIFGQERESAADLFGWVHEKILIFLPPRVVVLPEKGKRLARARSAKSGRGHGCTLRN